MDDGLTAINEKYEDIKKMLSIRAASALGETTLKIFVDLLDEYHRELIKTLELYDKQREGTKEENTMLLGLVGANEAEFKAKLVSQGEEIRFLRQQALELKKQGRELSEKNDALTLEVERFKNELEQSLRARDGDQKNFSERMEELTTKLKLFETLVSGREIEIDLRAKELNAKLNSLSEEVKDRSSEAVKRAVIRLNNILMEVNELSAALNSEIEAAKSAAQNSKKGPGFFTGKPGPTPAFTSILPTYNLLNEKLEEAVTILGKYMEVLSPPELTLSKVNWKKLFDDIKTKFSAQASAKKLKVNFPKEKMPAEFVSDQNLLLKAFSILLQNSIEALPVEGSIDVNIIFSSYGAEAKVSDSGKPIKNDQKDMLFMPLFTTKSSHYGMGLADCRRILKALGGSVVYEAYNGGNCFKMNFIPMKAAEQQTGA